MRSLASTLCELTKTWCGRAPSHDHLHKLPASYIQGLHCTLDRSLWRRRQMLQVCVYTFIELYTVMRLTSTYLGTYV